MHVLLAGLPGNPVSSYVCSFLFTWCRSFAALSGRGDLTAPIESALLGCDLPANDERADYLRATAKKCRLGAARDDRNALPYQDSSMMAALSRGPIVSLFKGQTQPAAKAG